MLIGLCGSLRVAMAASISTFKRSFSSSSACKTNRMNVSNESSTSQITSSDKRTVLLNHWPSYLCALYTSWISLYFVLDLALGHCIKSGKDRRVRIRTPTLCFVFFFYYYFSFGSISSIGFESLTLTHLAFTPIDTTKDKHCLVDLRT
jgi:hypothetical protein